MRLRCGRHIYFVNKFPYGSLKYVGGGIIAIKEFLMKRVLVFFIVGVVFFWACSVQSVNAQNTNISQRIIGTWVNNRTGGPWVFNADGKLFIGTDRVEYKFGVTESELAIISSESQIAVFDISISSDGRTLILINRYDSNVNRPLFSSGLWLTKQ